MKELKGELSGKLWDVVEGLLMTPEMYDAYQLHKAIKVRQISQKMYFIIMVILPVLFLSMLLGVDGCF